MMPLAPQLTVPHLGQISTLNMKASVGNASVPGAPAKPKLSFSIDSIVGGKRKARSGETAVESDDLSEAESLAKSLKRHLTDTPTSDGHLSGAASPVSADHHRSPGPLMAERHSVSPLSVKSLTPNGLMKSEHDISPSMRGTPSPNSLAAAQAASFAAAAAAMNPLTSIGVPPNPFHSRSPLAGLPPGHPLAGLGGLHGQLPPGMGAPPGSPASQQQQAMMMAAAAAAAASSGHSPNGLPGHPPPGFPHSPMDYQAAAMAYPWHLLRANPFGRFPGMPFDSPLGSFLLPPFRKPKRIRTAFSPGQLLKLEQAFEKNHYVVGNERKQLANHLGLSETQVKVWFQNRRTKHKRQKQDEEEGTGSSGGNGGSGSQDNSGRNYSDDEEEEIDLEDDEDEGHSDQDLMGEAMKFASMGQASGLFDPQVQGPNGLNFNNPQFHLWYAMQMQQAQHQKAAQAAQQQAQALSKSPQPPPPPTQHTASPL